MHPIRTLVASFPRRTLILAFCVGLGTAWPGLAQGGGAADLGPVVAASQAVVEALRAGAETGEVPTDVVQAAEALWLDQQADLIRTQAELDVLALRSSAGCPPVADVVKLVAERERRSFERLDRLRELQFGLPLMAAQSEKTEDKKAFMGLRLTTEPEDLTADPTP